LPSCATA
jgi:cell wall-associated NlpC family hydrolase